MNDIKKIMNEFNRIDRKISCKTINDDTDLKTYTKIVEGNTSAILDEKYLRESRASFDKPFGFIKSLNETQKPFTFSVLHNLMDIDIEQFSDDELAEAMAEARRLRDIAPTHSIAARHMNAIIHKLDNEEQSRLDITLHETASAGATSTGAVATAVGTFGAIQQRDYSASIYEIDDEEDK